MVVNPMSHTGKRIRKRSWSDRSCRYRRYVVLWIFGLWNNRSWGLNADFLERRSFVSTLLASSAVIPQDPSAPFVYSDSWSGTSLKIRTLSEATIGDVWPMGKWPDPALRIPSTPIDPIFWEVPEYEDKLALASSILRNTARKEGAVGLAAQQCGIDARMVYLAQKDKVLINPKIVQKSPESQLQVWTEECLVLPPTFRATVLRDKWIDVEFDGFYHYTTDSPKLAKGGKQRFFGEESRCLQHELDHDRGILITDHVGLEELENDVMRAIEAPGHYERQALAYSR